MSAAPLGPASGIADDLAQLRALLVRAARFELERRGAELGPLPARELDTLALEVAEAAAGALLARLGDYRGETRFATWAAKFAIREAAVRARQRGWAGRDIGVVRSFGRTAPTPRGTDGAGNAAFVSEAWARTADLLFGSDRELLERELLGAIALGGIPIDVVASRLGTSRGDLYRRLQEARKTLRRHFGPSWCPDGGGSEADAGRER